MNRKVFISKHLERDTENGRANLKMENMDLSTVTIILGAGAHVPYGFPTGKELKDIILRLNTEAKGINRQSDPKSQLNNKSVQLKIQVCELIFMNGHFKTKFSGTNSASRREQHITKEVESFIDRFAKSHNLSIDYFISRKGASEVDKLIGKALIGVTINYHEKMTNIGYHESDWIQTLINKYIRDDYTIFFYAPPTFITFNYDRLLEHSLILHLIYHHNLPKEKAIELVQSLPIIHVYGTLGKCTEENFSTFSHESIPKIDIIRGTINSNIEIKIQRQLLQSKKIYVFGFGYDRLNTQLLFGKLSPSSSLEVSRKIISSSRSLSLADKDNLYNLFKRPTEIEFYEEEIDKILGIMEPLEKNISDTKATVFIPKN